MYPTTENIYKMLANGEPQTARITVLQKDGSTYELTDADIYMGGLSVDRYSACGQKIEIGSAVSSELSLTLRNDGKLNDKHFQGAELFVEVGVRDRIAPRTLTTEKNTECGMELEIEDFNRLAEETFYPTVYIPLGWFKVENTPRSLSSISISALDRMICFDKYVQKNTLHFPCTVAEMLLEICTACGVFLADNTVSVLTNADYEIKEYPEQEDLTYRTLLIWIAQITGTCAYMDYDGHLRLDWYGSNNQCITVDETIRYSSDLQEQFITITGLKLRVGETVYQSRMYNDTYVVSIEGNLLLQENVQSVADALGNKIVGFCYIPFEATTMPMPFLFPMDMVDFIKNGKSHKTILTNVNYTLNGSTALAAKGETEDIHNLPNMNPFSPSQSTVIEKIQDTASKMQTDLSTQEKATLHLNQTAANAMGMYYSERADENGGIVRYWHDNASLENSLYICMQNSGGSFSTNTGWNDGNPHWTAGADKFGNAVVSLLNTVGIQAEWIRADSITTDKLSIGQSERGTNLIQDSSFEHGGVFVRGAYSGENEDVQIQSPAHNDHWNAVIFTGTDTYDIRYRDYLETPVVGGFDGNKAIVDVNFKGLSEGETEWFQGYEQIQPIPIDMLTHTVSFYYRVRRNPFGTAQGAETANAKYAFKIQWLNQNGTEISCTFQSFAVQSSQDDTWHRLYTTVTPPNNAQSARFAIGFVCTDAAVFYEDEETGEQGYPDLAWCDLDGILFEQGNTLNAWTCSEVEVRNTGVIINSNGVNVADGKISVTDIFGRKVLYTDGNNDLQLVGGLTSQMYDQSTQKIYAQMQILPSDNKNPYDDSSGAFSNNFLGQTFTKFDENGIAQPVGHIGMRFIQDENVSSDRPMEFYSENGFLFNGSEAALISAPVELGERETALAVQTPGWYTVSSDERAAALKQSPVKKAFVLQVCKFGNYVLQHLVARDGETHQRVFDAAQDTIPYNWYSLTGTPLETHPIGLGDTIMPGVYLQSTDVPSSSVQKSTDEYSFAHKFPTTDRGIFECFWGANGTKFHRYTDWRGQVWSRNYTKQYGWGFWRKNNVKT